MNLKKTALALAVAGITATPMAAQADLYASARIGLVNTDTKGNSEMQVKSMASRMGVKGEHDLGNGMTSFGHYEFGVNTSGGGGGNDLGDPEDVNAISTRHQYVGVKGDFGSVMFGQTYHTFYDFAYGPTDQPWWGAGYAVVLSPGRTDQGLTYAGGAGAVKFGVTLYMDGSSTDSTGAPNDIDGTELGLSFDAGFATFALGISDDGEDGGSAAQGGSDPEAVTMITVSGIQAGPVDLTIGYQTQDAEVGNATQTALIIHANAMGGYLHYESLDKDLVANDNPTSLTLGYTQSLGTNTTMWYEFQSYDADDGLASAASDDADFLRAILKVDF